MTLRIKVGHWGQWEFVSGHLCPAGVLGRGDSWTGASNELAQ